MPTLSQPDHPGSKSGDAARPPAPLHKGPRRDPEKRRLQNRQAQKIYRERQRQRLRELEALVSPISALLPTPSAESGSALGLELAFPALGNELTPSGADFVFDDALIDGDISGLFTDQQLSTDSWSTNTWMMGPTFETEETEGAEEEVIEIERHPHRPAKVWELVVYCSCTTPHQPHGSQWGMVGIVPNPVLISQIPDPYMNTIRIHQVCVVEAFRTNCLVLGITERMFCSDESESPFFRPHLDKSNDKDGLITSVQTMFRTLKHDLRPSKTQILRSHHPYIDVLPMPSVREKLIEMADQIDEDAFFHDAIRGMRCWGGRRESQRDQNVGTGTPWDMRSWEASEWLLKKWACVLGGDDDELARQSRWWRSMRGEE